MLSPPDGASWWGIISERFTSELWGTSLSVLSSSYGCHSPGTSSTRLLFQYSTFWYHHFFHVVPPVWKMLTALYIVDLLISAFSLCSFRPSTLSIKCLQFVIHSVVSVFLPGLYIYSIYSININSKVDTFTMNYKSNFPLYFSLGSFWVYFEKM